MVSLICTLQDHRDDVNWCAFSATLLATCSADKTLRIYHTRDFSEVSYSPLSGHGYGVHCCCFSACGQYLASCSTDGSTVVWSTVTGEIEAVLEHPGRSPVRVCAFSPDSSHLVSGASDGTLALWDFTTKTLDRIKPVDDVTMVACSFTPCGQMFMTGSTYGDLRLWDLSMNQLHAEKDTHDMGVSCCCFGPKILSGGGAVEFRLASCGQDSTLKIWIVSRSSTGGCKMQQIHSLTGQSAPVLSCSFSADGQLLVSGLWKAPSVFRQMVRDNGGPSEQVGGDEGLVCRSQLNVKISVDKTVTVYDASRGALLYTLNQHKRYVTACAFSPTAPLFATGSMDKTVNIWRVEERPGGHVEPATSSHEGGKLPGHSRLLVSDWSEEDVGAWLREEGLEALVETFKANNIDGVELIGLTKESLCSELNIESVGLRSKVLRKVEELKAGCVCTGVPDEFLCPITRELMMDPVIAADGYSYERAAIESWIATKNRSSPMTNLPLQTTLLTPNRTLKMAIGRWRTSQ
ncbi:WD repeat, SAM and U-box domain-containing protein 1 isoform X2 [Esox lucius]|uniref:WD repeat, SAM and U-box domain-containing protein 1 isoform X2 n=1 Tax=Esox lucius TaxID=8010 RepID=UPI0014774D5F|nr:WD repeat, SAM and U-box domain-containing protein 1 isoform X2 [Esox lucius]